MVIIYVRVLPKTVNQKGNYVVVSTTSRRNSLFDFSLAERRDGRTLYVVVAETAEPLTERRGGVINEMTS
jgi:hypothetical protein